jgi:hypothetical protein
MTMEKLTLAGALVLKTRLDLDLVETLYHSTLTEFENLDPIHLRSGANKTTGPGYQWKKTITEIDSVIKPLLAKHYDVAISKFTTTDSWLLLQTDEEWIDNPVHDHKGAGSVVVVCYLMTDPATDSISFFDDGDNESILPVMPGDVLIFSSSVKHRPNKTTTNIVKRVSYNLSFNVEQDETEESKSRMEICNGCDRLMQPVKICKECYCFMPAKTLIPISVCPLGKW